MTCNCFLSWWTWREQEVSHTLTTFCDLGTVCGPVDGICDSPVTFSSDTDDSYTMNTIPSPQTLRYKIQPFLIWGYRGRKHLPTRALHWHLKEPALTSYKHHLVCWSALFWGKSVHRTRHSLLSGLHTQFSTKYTLSQGKLVDTYNYDFYHWVRNRHWRKVILTLQVWKEVEIIIFSFLHFWSLSGLFPTFILFTSSLFQMLWQEIMEIGKF